VVPPKLTLITLTKNSLCDTENSSQRHSFQVRRPLAVIPLLYNGSSRIELLALRSFFQLGGPFGFCAFALLTPLLLGSLKIALKRTRPRQRFCV